MNTKLLEKCFTRILKEPERWDQSSWGDARPIDEVPAKMRKLIEEGADAACGTTACLAGHAMLLSGEWKQIITKVGKNLDDTLWSFSVDFRRVVDIDDSASGLEAEIGAELLDLDLELARVLFEMVDEVSPQRYVAWARHVIADYEATGGEYDEETGELLAIDIWDPQFDAFEPK